MQKLLENIKALLSPLKESGHIPEWLAQDLTLIFTLLILLIGIATQIFRWSARLIEYIRRRRLINDLSPYFTEYEVRRATQNYISTKYQNVAPSEDEEPGRHYIASAKNKLIPLFLHQVFKPKHDGNKNYLILADAGMGKTTFMINLYLNYKKQWRNKRFDIKLFPLGSPYAIQDVENIPDEQKKGYNFTARCL